jgi:hypothetical protein
VELMSASGPPEQPAVKQEPTGSAA